MTTLKVEVYEQAAPVGNRPAAGKPVKRFTVSGHSRHAMRQAALDQVDSKGAPKSAAFARIAGGKGPPDAILVRYTPGAKPAV